MEVWKGNILDIGYSCLYAFIVQYRVVVLVVEVLMSNIETLCLPFCWPFALLSGPYNDGGHYLEFYILAHLVCVGHMRMAPCSTLFVSFWRDYFSPAFSKSCNPCAP